MATFQMELNGTWTAYPSLLSSLGSIELQTTLEEAVCAGQCGRQEAAERLYNDLPRASELPLLALNRADMLTFHGRELERRAVLQDLLSSDKASSFPTEIHLLLKLMLADGDFWVDGKIRPVIQALARLRDYFKTRNTHSLSDIELRCVTMYYDAANNLTESSNALDSSQKTCFGKFYSDDLYAEIQAIRIALQQNGTWRFAPTFMQLELKHCQTGAHRSKTIPEAINMVQTLAGFAIPPILYRQALLAGTLSAMLAPVMPPLSENLKQAQLQTLTQITPGQYPSWETFCPTLATENEQDSILTSQTPIKDKYERLRELISRSNRIRTFTRSNLIYIKTRNMLKKAVVESTGPEQETEALQLLNKVGLDFITFHRETTVMSYFEAAALADYLSNVAVYSHNNQEIVRLVQEFEKSHQSMQIPLLMERLYDLAMIAAEALGNETAMFYLRHKYTRALGGCPFSQRGGGFINDIYLDPFHATRTIFKDAKNQMDLAINALKLMLQWSLHEIDSGQSVPAEIERIFNSATLITRNTSLPEEQLDSLAKTTFESCCGTGNNVTSTSKFIKVYSSLLDWLLLPDRLPLRAMRLDALKIFVRGRLYIQRMSLLTAGALPSSEDATNTSRESECLAEVISLTAAESLMAGRGKDEQISSLIQVTLTRSHAVTKDRPVTMEEIDQRRMECRELIKRLHGRTALFTLYFHLVQLIRLNWRKMLLFNIEDTDPIHEEVLNLAREAETVYRRISNAMRSSDASNDLLAIAKTANDFSRSEHYKYAFAALYLQYSAASHGIKKPTSETAETIVNKLANWSLSSKGRGFLDILEAQKTARDVREAEKLDDSIGQNITQQGEIAENLSSSTDQEPDAANLSTQMKSLDLSEPALFGANQADDIEIATHDDVQAMLDSIDESTVFVDVIACPYGIEKSSLLALLYRKHTPIALVDLPVTVQEAAGWVDRNLDSLENVKNGTLASGDSQDTVDELANLILPLLESRNGVSMIPAGFTIVFCLTSFLGRIPLHAISVNGSLVIKRNPVVYTQSLTSLYQSWKRLGSMSDSKQQEHKAAILCPLRSTWRSSFSANTIAEDLKIDKVFHGPGIQKKDALAAMKQCSVFNFQGHAGANRLSALDSAILLIDQVDDEEDESIPQDLQVTAADIIRSGQLRFPALCTIIGCASGVGTVSTADDALGLPTAFLYAGASSVVSTLWVLLDSDGAAFATSFYKELSKACTNARDLNQRINLANVMQTAVLRVLDHHSKVPFHWASFYLQGLWIFPLSAINVVN